MLWAHIQPLAVFDGGCGRRENNQKATTMSDFREVSGNRQPLQMETGSMFGNVEHHLFCIASATDIRFPEEAP